MIAALLLLSVGEPVVTPSPVLEVPAAPATPLVLRAGTPIRLTTVDKMDSRSVIQGERFPLSVAEDVAVNGHVVIPGGTAAVGEVEALSGKGMVGKAGKLVLSPLFIELSGRRVQLVGTTEQQGRDSTTGVAVTSLLLTSLGIFITGGSATVPAGSVLFAKVRTDVRLEADQR